MIRLAIVTALLAVALVVVKRRTRRGPSSEALRVTSRTGISRGVLAAVLEVEQRRFLVTITATSTTLVAELGPDSLPVAADVLVGPPAPVAAPFAPPVADPFAAARGRLAAPGAVTAPTAPTAAVAPPAVAGAAAPGAPGPPAGATFLDRIRARTLRTYDPVLLGSVDEGR